MAISKNILRNASLLFLALIAPVVIVTLTVYTAQNDRQYLVCLTLAEIAGVFCLIRLSFKLWIRLVCIAIYLPVSCWYSYLYTILLVLGWPWRGPHC
jgi:hypothetical protein